MYLPLRRFLTGLFALILFVISPLILLYANGYHFNFSTMRIERFGLLYVDTDPADITLLLDNKAYDVNGEFVLNRLPEKTYEISVLKEGYHTWRKRLSIVQGQSTFVRDLILLKKVPATSTQVITGPITPILDNSPTHVYQQGQNILLTSSNATSSTIVPLESSEELSRIRISANRQRIVFMQEGSWYNLDIDQAILTPLGDLSDTIHTVIPVGQDQGTVLLSDTQMASVERDLIITLPLIQDVYAEDEQVWIMNTDPGKERSFLYVLESNSDRPRLVTSLPYSASYIIDEDFSGFLTIIDKENTILYLVDTNILPAQTRSLFGVHTWRWSDDHSQLLTANDFEVIIYHIQDQMRQELIVRLSSLIEDVSWLDRESHIFYVTNDSLFIAERDDRVTRNIFALIQNRSNLKILSNDEDGENLFLRADHENLGIEHLQLELR